MPWVLSVVTAADRHLVVTLSLGCDGGPSVVSDGRRFQMGGGRAVIVRGVGGFLPRDREGSQPQDTFVDEVDPGALALRWRRTCRPVRAIVAGRGEQA